MTAGYYFEGREKAAVIATAVVGSLCFATMVTLVVMHVLGYLKSCCRKILGKGGDKDPEDKDSFVKGHQKLGRDLRKRRKIERGLSQSLPNLDYLSDPGSFKIPGHIMVRGVQPITSNADTDEDSPSDSPVSVASSASPVPGHRRAVERMSLPITHERMQPHLADLRYSSYSMSIDYQSPNDSDFEPDLYLSRRSTIGVGNLGKIVFFLSYSDKSRRKLDITLHNITKLQLMRTGYTGVSVAASLLPERDVVYTTEVMEPGTELEVNKSISFQSKPNHRDFEARTLNLNIVATEKSGRQVVNCQARLPLLDREIYTQIHGSFGLNLIRRPNVEETGDLYLQLCYTPESDTLTILIRCIKFISASYLESLTGLRLKAYAKCYGAKLSRKRMSFHNVPQSPSPSFDIDEQLSFKIPNEKFLEASVKILIVGKHKCLGKSVALGRVRVGDAPAEDVGMIHWKHAFSQPSVASLVWHPVCLG